MSFLDAITNPKFVAYLPTAFVFIAGIIGTIISKERDFDARCRKLKSDFLQMKVNTLITLIEQVQYPPDTLSAAEDVDAKGFFIDIEKYSKYEKRLRWYNWLNNFVNNFLFCGILLSIVFGVMLSAGILQTLVVTVSLIILSLEIIALILARLFQQKIWSMENLEDLGRLT